jgi:hypothetical protein
VRTQLTVTYKYEINIESRFPAFILLLLRALASAATNNIC